MSNVVALRTRNILSLCAGVGGLELGIALALHARGEAARGICYVEREAAAAASLVASMGAGWLHPAPVWSDMLTFDARRWRGHVHILASGDPCQENSVAGKRAGAKGARFLAPEVCRVADECRPDHIFRENVPGNADGQLEAIVPALERLGYRVAAGIFSSAETGNSMRRERLFIMAERDSWRCVSDGKQDGQPGQPGERASFRNDADKRCARVGNVAVADGGCGGDRQLQRSRKLGLLSESDGASRDASAVGSAADERYERAGRTRGRRSGPANAGGELAGASGTGSQGLEPGKYHPARRQESGGHARLCSGAVLPPAVIPGPTDSRWIDVLGRWPELQPALSQEEAESHLRRGIDAMAHRIERLRATGNGVDPVVAAYAFLRLDARLAAARSADAASDLRAA